MFNTPQTTVVLLNSDERLRLPDEPPKSFMPALPLQFCSNYFPALLMVVVHPVALGKGRRYDTQYKRRRVGALTSCVQPKTFVGPWAPWD